MGRGENVGEGGQKDNGFSGSELVKCVYVGGEGCMCVSESPW